MISSYILQCRKINESGSFEEDRLEKYISNVLESIPNNIFGMFITYTIYILNNKCGLSHVQIFLVYFFHVICYKFVFV